MRKHLIAAAAAAVLLAACGNDDNGGDSSVSLSSAGDVLREFGNINSGITTFGPGIIVGAAGELRPGSEETLAVIPKALRKAAAKQMQKVLTPRANAAAADATNCSLSGSDTFATDQSKTRAFTLFSGTSLPVTYSTDNFNACTVQQSSTSTISGDGVLEQGSGTSSDSTTQGQYYLFGSGSTPLHFKAMGTISSGSSSGGSSGGSSSLTVNVLGLGTLEQVSTTVSGSSSSGGESSSTQSGERFLTAFSASVAEGGTTKFNGEIDLGTTSTPFSVSESDDGTGSIFIGPYRYTSTEKSCKGGKVTVATTTPLVSGNTDDTEGSYVSGVLTFTSGGQSATITFNSDGTATISGSASGTASVTDVQNAVQAPACFNVEGAEEGQS